MLKRSILTEKVARRGYHLIGEYSIDPLELLYVREVMRTKILVLSANMKLKEILPSLRMEHRQEQRLLPVVNTFGQLVGILTRKSIREKVEKDGESVHEFTLGEIAHANAIEAFPDEPLRAVVYRMAEKGITRMPVVVSDTGRFLGLISLDDLLRARTRHLEEEQRREKPLNLRWLMPNTKSAGESQT
jgi:CIC family chloride channel protein